MMPGDPMQPPQMAQSPLAGQGMDQSGQPGFQPPSPEALDFVHKLLQSSHPKHTVHVTHVSIHPAHKAKHGHLMKGRKK